MSTATAPILSAQEKAIVEGTKLLHGTATERILRTFEAIRSSGPPRVALERGDLLHRVFQDHGRTAAGPALTFRLHKEAKPTRRVQCGSIIATGRLTNQIRTSTALVEMRWNHTLESSWRFNLW